MPDTALKSQSKTSLAKRVVALTARARRASSESEQIGERVMDLAGGGVAFATAASIGFIEGRFRNKDKTAISLGPVPLTLAAAAATSAIALATGSRWASAATNGALGAYGYGLGLAGGVKSRVTKGRSVSGIGDELMEDDVAEHYFGD